LVAVREEDKTSFYHNSNYLQTVKRNFHDERVKPTDYKAVETVVKGVTNAPISVRPTGSRRVV
jgi:hypothetical protein